MPLYEYRCRECGHRFEILQRMGEGADGLVCAECGEPHLEKLLSSFSSSGSGAGGTSVSAGPGCGGGGFT